LILTASHASQTAHSISIALLGTKKSNSEKHRNEKEEAMP